MGEGVSTHTDRAHIVGAGYLAGAYFFVRVARATRWHRVHLGFLPITAFAAFLGVATMIYWDWCRCKLRGREARLSSPSRDLGIVRAINSAPPGAYAPQDRTASRRRRSP
jgi:hypothetical protein